MTTLAERLEAIRASLAAACPARVVTRNFRPIQQLAPEDLERGHFALCSKGERGFKNYNGREAMDGAHAMFLVGRFQLDSSADGLAVESQELAMVEEVKAWLRALPEPINTLVCNGFEQSGQLHAPIGLVVFELEFIGDDER